MCGSRQGGGGCRRRQGSGQGSRCSALLTCRALPLYHSIDSNGWRLPRARVRQETSGRRQLRTYKVDHAIAATDQGHTDCGGAHRASIKAARWKPPPQCGRDTARSARAK